jgi:SAM-dependent methyltransferase
MMEFKRLPTHILRDSCFESLVRGWKPGNFLEIGPGSGSTTKIFLEKGFKGTLFDISKESREILAVNIKEYIQSIKIIEDLGLVEKKSFDYLFIFDVIEHIDDDLSTLKEFTGYLKDGGIVLISVPAHKKEFGKSDELMGHFRRYEKTELYRLLERSGYSEIEILNYGFPLINVTLRTINLIYRLLGNREEPDYGKLSLNERTQKSGISNPEIVKRLSIIFNSVTVLPFIFLQRLFLKKDWGVAYIAYARKS